MIFLNIKFDETLNLDGSEKSNLEVENGGLEDDWLVSKEAIFHFHDYGRKGNHPDFCWMVIF